MRLLNLEQHGLQSDLAINTLPVPIGRRESWRAFKCLRGFVTGLVAVFKIVVLHLILTIRGVPHRISFGEMVEDERDSPMPD